MNMTQFHRNGSQPSAVPAPTSISHHLESWRRVWSRILLTLLLIGLTIAAGDAAPTNMVAIPASTYTPLYKSEAAILVDAFYLDTYPATNAEFLEFVRANPAWRKSQVKRLFADESYLRRWAGDLDLGDDAEAARRPVTHVSWFAANAYAQWQGKRLPTLAEWEVASAAGITNAIGANETGHTQRILDWYSRPARRPLPAVGSTFKNVFGNWDMHGLVWEWVWDFNTALVTGESRADASLDEQRFCGSGAFGASDFRDYPGFMRMAFRSSLKANYTVANLGFRCAKEIDPP